MDSNNFQMQNQNANINNVTASADLNTIAAILKDIQENEKKEMKYAKRQSIFSLLISLACLFIVAFVSFSIFKFIPKVEQIVDDAQTAVSSVNDIIGDTSVAIKNLNKVADDLARVDIDKLFEEVSSAIKRLDAIDFEGLNTAIGDLGAIIAPLASFFK